MTLDKIVAPVALEIVGAAKLSNLNKKLSEVSEKKFENINKLGLDLSSLRGFASSAASSLSSFVSSLNPIAIGAAAATAGIVALGVGVGKAKKALADFEDEADTFCSILLDSQAGLKLADDMREFGLQTLFTQDAITRATSSLLSYGKSADEAKDIMKMFGEIAGNNSEGLAKLGEIYTRMEAKGQVSVRDLEQLRRVGIDIGDVVASQAGIAADSLYDMASKGKISFADVQEALKNATSEGGKFFSNTARAAETLSQAQEQYKKTSTALFLEIGKALEPILVGFQNMKTQIVSSLIEPLRDAIAFLGQFIEPMAKLKEYFGAILNIGREILGVVFSPLKAVLTDTANTLSYLPTVFQTLFSTIEPATNLAIEAFNLVAESVGLVGDVITLLIDKFIEFRNYIVTKVYDAFKWVIDPLVATFTKIKDVIEKIVGKMKEWVGLLKGFREEIQGISSEGVPENLKTFEKDEASSAFAKVNPVSRLSSSGSASTAESLSSIDAAFSLKFNELQSLADELQREVLLTPLEKQKEKSKEIEEIINTKNKEFVEEFASLYSNLHTMNKKTLVGVEKNLNDYQNKLKALQDEEIAKKAKQLEECLGQVAVSFKKVFNENLGKDLVTKEDGGLSSVAGSLYGMGKSALEAAGPWGQLASGALDFIGGILKGIDEKTNKEIDRRRDLKLKNLEMVYDKEIEMRRGKLNDLDTTYNKELEFYKEAQRRGEISGEEFYRVTQELESNYSSKKSEEELNLAKSEKLSELEKLRVNAEAELEKVEKSVTSWARGSEKEALRGKVSEILARINRVNSASTVDEVKYAKSGALFQTNSPTLIPGINTMASEFGQGEMVKITPAPVEQNLRQFEARILADELTKLQGKNGGMTGIVNNYIFNGDILDAEKLLRLLEEQRYKTSFRSSGE